MSIEKIPTALLKQFLTGFLDLKSFASFALTNKRNFEIFNHIPILFRIVLFAIQPKKIEENIKTYARLTLDKCSTKLLHLACKYTNSLQAIKCLVENKSEINSKTRDNQIPLHMACRNENISFEIIEYLIQNKSQLNAIEEIKYSHNKNQPLHLACRNKNITIEIIKLLIENKANLNSTDQLENLNEKQLNSKEEIENTLHCAIKNKSISLEIIEYMIDKNCGLDVKDDYNQNLSIHLACQNKSNNSFQLIKLLAEKKSDLNALNHFGETPLHCASSNTTISLEAINYLVQNKSDPNIKNKYDETCLQLISKNRSLMRKFGPKISIEKILQN